MPNDKLKATDELPPVQTQEASDNANLTATDTLPPAEGAETGAAPAAQSTDLANLKDRENPNYGTDSWYKAKAENVVGSMVPQWAMKPLGWLSKNYAEPVQQHILTPATEAVEAGGRIIGAAPAHALTAIQHPELTPSPYKMVNGKVVVQPETAEQGAAREQKIEQVAAQEHPVIHGVGAGVGEFAGGLLSPENLALMAAMPEAEAAPMLSKLASLGFAGQMAKGTADQFNNLRENWGKMTPDQRAESLTQLAAGAGMTTLAGTHAAHQMGVEVPQMRPYGGKAEGLQPTAADIGKTEFTKTPARPDKAYGAPPAIEVPRQEPGLVGNEHLPEAKEPTPAPTQPRQEMQQVPYPEAPTQPPVPKGAEALGRIGAPEAKPAAETGEKLAEVKPPKSSMLGEIKYGGEKPASETGEALGSIKTNREITPEVAREAEAAHPAPKPEEVVPPKSKNIPYGEIAENHNKLNGFSYNPERGFMRDQPVFSVGGEYPDIVQVIKGQNISGKDVQAFAERPDVKAALEADPRNSIGGWKYKGNSHLEISKTFDNRDEAIAEGKRLNQHSIYDHATRSEIPTGGTAAEEEAAKAGVAPAPAVEEPKAEETKAPKDLSESDRMEFDGRVRNVMDIGPESLNQVRQFVAQHTDKPVTYLNHGTEAVIMDLGNGKVARIHSQEPTGLPDIPEVLKPEASKTIQGATKKFTVDILPKVDTKGITPEDVQSVKKALDAKGVYFKDASVENVGRMPDGRLVVIDRGAIEAPAKAEEAAPAAEARKTEQAAPAQPTEDELKAKMQRQYEHILGKDNMSKISSMEGGDDLAKKLRMGTNQQWADLANELGPFKPGNVNAEWAADDFKKLKGSKDASPNKLKVLEHLLREAPEDLRESVKDWKAPEPKEYGEKNKLVTKEDAAKAADSIRERLARFPGQKFVGEEALTPHDVNTLMQDALKLAAYHLEAGAREFGDWASKMVADLGTKITPHLDYLWDKATAEDPKFEASRRDTEDLKEMGFTDDHIGTLKKMYENPKIMAGPEMDEFRASVRQPNQQLVMKDANGKKTGTRTIQRKGFEANDNSRALGLEEIKQAGPEYMEKLADKIRNISGALVDKADNAETVINKFIDHVADNTEWVYNKVPEALRQVTRHWYDGNAHTMTKELADTNGYTHHQIAGVTAVLSPQNDWDNNIDSAKRVVDFVKNKAETAKWGKKMDSKLDEIKGNSPNLTALAKEIRGKRYSSLKDTDPAVELEKKALWLRVYDEAMDTERAVYTHAPDGSIVGRAMNTSGEPSQANWFGLDSIAKAISILHDGSMDNINSKLGFNHKVRNFYNNIISPNSAAGDVTVDTHAVGVGEFKPLSLDSPEVKMNFGPSPKHSELGLSGSYALYAEGYRRAAARLGILPRELQSVTWDAIRTLFEDKNEAIMGTADKAWKEYKDGKVSADEARERIYKAAGGFKVPRWLTDLGNDEEARNSAHEKELARNELSGKSSEGRRGGGGSTTGAAGRGVEEPEHVNATRKTEGSTEFNTEELEDEDEAERRRKK